MFDEEIKKKISFLKIDKDCIEQSDKMIELKETQKQGEVNLNLEVNNPCIAFKKLDDNIFQYLKCGECADDIIFEKSDNTWILHIIEFKRTVKSDEWIKVKSQFKGAFLNAIVIAGYLGIKINMDNIKLYTGFRNDKILKQRLASPAELKGQIGKSLRCNDTEDWESGQVLLSVFNTIVCIHTKIQLDVDTGQGKFTI